MNKSFKAILFVCLPFLFLSCEDCEFPTLRPRSLLVGEVGQSYFDRIEIDSECSPAFVGVRVAGNLPPGVIMNEFGDLIGTPTREGEYTFVVDAEICYSGGAFAYFDCYYRSKRYTLVVE